MEINKDDLTFKELKLKVRELELKVDDLEKPPYKKISFWTSTLTVVIAIGGLIAQSYLSNIRNSKAELETKEAIIEKSQAEKEMQAALAKKASAIAAIEAAARNLDSLKAKKDSLEKDYAKISGAYNKIVAQTAYYNNKTDSSTMVAQRVRNTIIESNALLSNILLTKSSDLLLKNSILKVYYLPATKSKAIAIDQLLKSHNVKSEYTSPGYDISGAAQNEIVYYNEPQLNYCKAVQALLAEAGWGTFEIRKSSGANTTTAHFKIYVVK